MKFLRCEKEGAICPAALDQSGTIRDISSIVDDINGAELANNLADTFKNFDLQQLPEIEPNCRIAEPVADIGKIICVGLNYADHAAESGMEIPEEPILFMKPTTSICGPNDDVEIPPNSQKVDWEVELGIVISKQAKYVPLEKAMDHVAGFVVVNDLSERHFQLERGGQWVKGKGCDTFAPIGPYLATPDEINDPSNLDIWLEVNGRRFQNGNTRTMIFDVSYLVHYISQFMRLEPGDLISTGTPPGVGLGQNPQVWLKPGDTISLGIEGLGEQRQSVVMGSFDG